MAKKAKAAETENEPTDESPVDAVENGPGEDFMDSDLNPLDSLDMGFKLPAEQQAVLDFDPFAKGMEGDPEPEPLKEGENDELEVKPKADEGKNVAEGEGEPAADAAAADASKDPAPDPRPGDQEGKQEPSATPDSRDTQVADLTRMVANLQEQVTAAAKPAASDGDTPVDDGKRFYRDVPEPMMNLINSEDPGERKQGVQALIQGTAMMVHAEVMKDVEARLSTVQTETTAENTRNTQLMETYADFYKQFPTLNDDAIRPMVSAEAQIVFKEQGTTQWSTAVRDAIGNRVINKLKGFAPSAPAADAGGNGDGGGKSSQKAQPASLKGGGSRPASTAGTESEGEIADVIFGPGR